LLPHCLPSALVSDNITITPPNAMDELTSSTISEPLDLVKLALGE